MRMKTRMMVMKAMSCLRQPPSSRCPSKSRAAEPYTSTHPTPTAGIFATIRMTRIRLSRSPSKADAGWTFVEWQGDPECATGSVEMNADKTCLARFTPYSGGGGGGAPPAPQCGNGVPEAGEDCDDAGESATCDADCTLVECGDGTLNVTAGEECDDGGHGRTATAVQPRARSRAGEPECGNGVPETGEECDDGNEDNTDACLDTCKDAECGDGFIRAGVEACDDAGESATCDADCTPAECGDGTLNEIAGEKCDDGGTVDGDGWFIHVARSKAAAR